MERVQASLAVALLRGDVGTGTSGGFCTFGPIAKV